MSMLRGGPSRRGGDQGDHPQVGPQQLTVIGSNIQAQVVEKTGWACHRRGNGCECGPR